ncbi:MAG TPA: hypothetical protein VGQ46_07230 [Thermoanaerobaculia bacterium]|jgi:hypothetical protein|nr:hypothetical protein [Thermoanaerobaculia bacterium]
MNRNAALFLIGSSLLLNACATHTHATAPVVLNISSDTATKTFVNQMRATALDAITKAAPNARPMTINVKLDVTTQSKPALGLAPAPANEQRQVATLSPDPMSEAAPPTVPVNTSAFRSERIDEITDYRVQYTITDAAGRVVESNALTLDHGHLVNTASGTPVDNRNRLNLRNELVNDTAGFLASRVKTLSR